MFSHEQQLEKLKYFLCLPTETEWLEIKEAKEKFEFDEIGKYFSALSNGANLKHQQSGWLIFGVKDRHPRIIVGTDFKKDPRKLNSLKHEISQYTNGLSFQEIYEILLPEGRVLIFQIPAAPAGMPTSWKGHYYGRNGESLSPLSMYQIETIRQQEQSIDWSAQICVGATIRDLDDDALKVAREKFLKKNIVKSQNQDMERWDLVTFLDKAKLTKNGHITKTALLLLGKPESVHYMSPHPCQITWKLEGEESAYAHFGPPFIQSVEEVYKHIRNIKFRFQPTNQLIPIELSKYDPKTILEAINNCIAHQDYSQNARIVIVERVDHLNLQNIGSFYDGTVDDYVLHERTPERYRNSFLVQAMVNLDMIDTMGMGIRRMFMEQRKRYFPLPEYDLKDPNHVCLTIYGKLLNENYSRALIENQDLTLDEVIALDRIQKRRDVSKEAVQRLKKKRLVEGRYPNIFVAAHIADATDGRAQYIKNKAFDADHYQQMILKYLERYKSATRQDLDTLIVDKLPEILSYTQKRNKIGNILGSMRKAGLIENQGSDRKPVWIRLNQDAVENLIKE